MQTVPITLDAGKAHELYQAYKRHAHYGDEMDDEIRQAYRLLAKGELIIKAIESVRLAGLNEQGLPKLALLRLDKQVCRFDRAGHDNTGGTMYAEGYNLPWQEGKKVSNSVCFRFPHGTFPPNKAAWGGRAFMPPVPLHIRPRRALTRYHVLWEAEWERVPPRDPYLLRRIGKADMWLVCGMWDLTEVERAALATRIVGNA